MKKAQKISIIAAILLGTLLVVGGIWGIYFTYQSVARENIVTPADAAIPNTPVRGPFTLKAQADIIRTHALKSTGGKTFAEMPQQIPKLDEEGNQVLDAEGDPVMEANTARTIWITATTLTTALTMAILAYVLSALVMLGGFIVMSVGIIANRFVK